MEEGRGKNRREEGRRKKREEGGEDRRHINTTPFIPPNTAGRKDIIFTLLKSLLFNQETLDMPKKKPLSLKEALKPQKKFLKQPQKEFQNAKIAPNNPQKNYQP